MSDFKIHPALTSPAMGAVVSGLLAMGVVDSGIADLLQATGGVTTFDVNDWNSIVITRWGVMGVSAFLGYVAWFILFHGGRVEIKVPAAGVAFGIFGAVLSAVLIWSLSHSIDTVDFQLAAPVIQNIAFLWSILAMLFGTGCVLIGLRSYRIMKRLS